MEGSIATPVAVRRTHPLVSVVVLSYRRREELLRTLGRLHWLPERPEIIVVDNASGDGTAEAVSLQFPNMRLVRRSSNIGAAGRNDGVAEVRTPYVAFADDDSYWDPGALERAVAALHKHPQLGLVAARVLVGDEQRLEPACAQMARSPRRAGLPGREVLGFIACAAVMRVAAFREVGGFRRQFFVGGEEELMALDLAAAGWCSVYLDAVVARHIPSPVRERSARHRVVARNAIWTAWMRRPAAVAVRHTLARLSAPDLRGQRWRTAVETVRGLPWALRQRRLLPPQVENLRRRIEAAER